MGEPLLKEALRASAITLTLTLGVASCGNVAVAEPPAMVAASKPVMPPTPIASPSDPAQTGYQPSAYKGRKFRKTQERLRRCIGQREGRFQYWGTGGDGRYQSTYQMTPALLRGAAWMMRPELIAEYGKQGAHVFRVLLRTPGHLWSRFYMDAAFYTVLNARGELSGLGHWKAGRYAC